MVDNLSDDDLFVIYKSILGFLNENADARKIPTTKQEEMDIVLKKYNLEMIALTEYLSNKYDNSGVPFYDKNKSAITYFILRSRELYSGLIALIRERKIDNILYG